MKIYLASSWRNARQPEVLAALRAAGHEVYDFRNPVPGNNGFGWKQLGLGDQREWMPEIFRNALKHPVAQQGFEFDMNALQDADATVLLLPCGRSAHLELGYAVGAEQATFVLTDKTLDEPELMYLMCTGIATSLEELLQMLKGECANCGHAAVHCIASGCNADDDVGYPCDCTQFELKVAAG